MYDVLIKNGYIVDGTGANKFRADVGIKDDKIVKIGELHNEKGEVDIDAEGKIVCPGFIDVNNHSDTYWQIFLDPELESLIYQGITTIIGGNCGSSLAPLPTPKTIETIQKWADIKKVNVNWLTLNEFFGVVGKAGLSVNFATLVGHATLRRGLLKDSTRALAPKEINYMNKKLSEAMGEGALGLSSGLVYSHARLAATDELIELASVIAKYGGIYTSHIRGEEKNLLEAVEEAIEIAQKSGVKLHISHLKAMGETNWSKMNEALRIIDHAKENGIDVSFDIYPYSYTASVLYSLLPGWVGEGGKRLMLQRIRGPIVRSKIIFDMKKTGLDYSQAEVMISPLNKTLARRKISDIAKSQGKSPEEAVLDVLIASEGRAIVSMEAMSQENIEKEVLHPLSIISTNGSGYNIDHAKTGEVVHPRCFGALTRILSDYVLKNELLSWEEAVKKMTSYPAEKFGIKKRGMIKKGFFADVLVLDPRKIESPASKENPYVYSKGVDFMLVNGRVVIESGSYLGKKAGQIIKR